jgi:hypothetical protein
MRRLRGVRPVLFLLGGGVFVALGVGAVRYALHRRAASPAPGAPESAEARWAGSVPVALPPAEAAPTVAESVVPLARDPEAVVDGLMPPELTASRSNTRLDLLIAAAVIVAAFAVALLLSGNIGAR